MNFQNLKKYFNHHKKLYIIILVPLFASILLFYFQNKAANCAFVLIVMSLYWTTGFTIIFYLKKLDKIFKRMSSYSNYFFNSNSSFSFSRHYVIKKCDQNIFPSKFIFY